MNQKHFVVAAAVLAICLLDDAAYYVFWHGRPRPAAEGCRSPSRHPWCRRRVRTPRRHPPSRTGVRTIRRGPSANGCCGSGRHSGRQRAVSPQHFVASPVQHSQTSDFRRKSIDKDGERTTKRGPTNHVSVDWTGNHRGTRQRQSRIGLTLGNWRARRAWDRGDHRACQRPVGLFGSLPRILRDALQAPGRCNSR